MKNRPLLLFLALLACFSMLGAMGCDDDDTNNTAGACEGYDCGHGTCEDM